MILFMRMCHDLDPQTLGTDIWKALA